MVYLIFVSSLHTLRVDTKQIKRLLNKNHFSEPAPKNQEPIFEAFLLLYLLTSIQKFEIDP
jgi:hypothetical protein